MVHFGAGAPQGYSFQYSSCKGKRKALLIGINYFGQRGELRGCINDVKNMSTYLNQNFGYAREDMVILTDDQQNPMSQPTKQNLLRAMHWLVKDAQPNDSLFFHYSGTHPFHFLHFVLTIQATAAKPKTSTATKTTATTKSSTPLTSAPSATSWTTTCTTSWCARSNQAFV